MVNNMIGFVIFALFISIIDRYFSGENYKQGEWVNGISLKAKIGLSIIIALTPYFFSGFFYSQILYTPFYIVSMIAGLYLGEFFLRSYDWAFKQGAQKKAEIDSKSDAAGTIESNVKAELVDKAADMVKNAIGAGNSGDNTDAADKNNSGAEDGGSQKTVVDAIVHAGGEIKEGLKNLGDGIAKASENVLKKDPKEPEKKDYKPNDKLNDKLKNY
ncbi:MAG: hypothetical protein QMC67_00915 [Candidatus Wallbacteria bacterium]